MDFDSIFSPVNWTVDRPDGDNKTEQKWLKHQSDEMRYTAYFKPASKGGEAPLCANEFLTAKFAEKLDIPHAKVQLYTLEESYTSTPGVISHFIEGSTRWADDVGKDKLQDPTAFSKVFCFDSWVHHLDRSGQNLVHTRSGETYILHLIDNESALYGTTPNVPEHNADNFNCAETIKLSNNPKLLVSRDELTNFATTIQELPDNDIISIVSEFRDGAPDYLSAEQAQHVINKLTRRKALLVQQIAEWYDR